MRDIVARPEAIEVVTDDEAFLADRVIVCAGAWRRRLLSSSLGVDLPITLTQEQVTYFSTPCLRELTPDRFPIWIWHDDPVFYGFPVYTVRIPALRRAEIVLPRRVKLRDRISGVRGQRDPRRDRGAHARRALDVELAAERADAVGQTAQPRTA
jgi:glycine/D-amino acid oxidase-like deaminating enzyme